MSKSSNHWDAHPHIYRNNLLWDKLYNFLAVRVRYWVYSARLSLWNGQEEEIAEDIIQDAIIGALTYALQCSLGSGEKETVLAWRLLQISIILAHQDYRQREERDAPLVQTRLGYNRAQGFLALARDESADWQEGALSSALQEWFCECLAGTVMKIPLRPRVALLTHWANHLRAGSQQARILVGALSKRDVRLLEFQGPLSEDPREQRRHRALLRFAYRQMLREPEQERHIFLPGVACGDVAENEQSRPDRALLMVGAHLEATAPTHLPALAFREGLRDKLLDMVVEYQIARATTDPVLSGTTSASASHVRGAESAQKDATECAPKPFEGSEVEGDEIDDTEMDMLAEFLKGMTPLAQIDPVFRATLREKLLAIPRTYAESVDAKTMDHTLDQTERFLAQAPQESGPLPDDIEDDEPAQFSLAWLRMQSASRPSPDQAAPGND